MTDFRTLSSLGGGFRVSFQAEAPLTKTDYPSTMEQQPVERKQDLVSNLDWEIEKLRRFSTNISGDRRAFITQEETPQSLEQIERLRLANKERLKVLEQEYLAQRQEKPKEEANKTSVLEDYVKYKKKPGWNQFKREEPKDPRTVLLKWMFSKIDKDNSGTIDKYELIAETAKHPETAEILGIKFVDDYDVMVETVTELFEDVGHNGLIGLDEFIVFMLGRSPYQYSASFIDKKSDISNPKLNSYDANKNYQEISSAKQSTSQNIGKAQGIPQFTSKNSLNNKNKNEKRVTITDESAYKALPRQTNGLSDKQISILEKVFNDLDIYKDNAVPKFEYIQTLKTSEEVIKFLNAEITPDKTLEDILDEMIDIGGAHDYITFSQFLGNLNTYKPQEAALPSKEKALPKPPIDEIYLQILLDIFDSLPRRAPSKISTSEYVESVRSDPQAQEFLYSKLTNGISVAGVLQNIEREAGVNLSWEDVITFLSNKQKKRAAARDDSMLENTRPPISKSKPIQKSTGKITVPQPFQFDSRERSRSKSIRQKKIEEVYREKYLEEEYHLNYRPKVNEPPAEVMIPKYDAMLAAQEARRLEVKQNSKALTMKLQKPFKFSEKKNKQVLEEEKPEPFRAKPPPPSTHVKIFEMRKFAEEERKKRIEEAALKLLSESKLPPRMENYTGGKTKHIEESKNQFKAKDAPNFQKLQHKFTEALEKKKGEFKPTQVKEFNFGETKKKSVREDDDALLIAQKAFLGIVKKDVKPGPPPKMTANQTKLQEHKQKVKDQELKLKEQRDKEEMERAKRHEEAKKRVIESGTIAKRNNSQNNSRNLNTATNYKKDRDEMINRVNARPMMSATISSTNEEARGLHRIKQMMMDRGIDDIAYEGAVDSIPAESLV